MIISGCSICPIYFFKILWKVKKLLSWLKVIFWTHTEVYPQQILQILLYLTFHVEILAKYSTSNTIRHSNRTFVHPNFNFYIKIFYKIYSKITHRLLFLNKFCKIRPRFYQASFTFKTNFLNKIKNHNYPKKKPKLVTL